jgi:hypothetical protein
MASVGPQMYFHLSLDNITRCWSLPSLPPHTDVTPLMCSGLMVVGHRLDCYSLLSVVFAVFLGHPGHGSLAQDILSLFTLIPPMRVPPTWPLCGALLVRNYSVVSLQTPSRTALNVSLLRYIAFVFRLLVCLVPPIWGSRTCVSKGVEGNSRRRYIRTNILHPHHSHFHPHSTPPTPPIPLPVALPTNRSTPGCGLLIYTLFVSDCCRLSCAGPHHILGGPNILRDSLGLE